jgi:hypothetical protein
MKRSQSLGVNSNRKNTSLTAFVELPLLCLILLPAISRAQTTRSEPEIAFDAASVKLSASGPVFTTMQGGPGTSDPGRVSYKGISLRNVLAEAGGVRYDAVRGPAWLDKHQD